MGTVVASSPVGAAKVTVTSAEAPAATVTKADEKVRVASPETRGTSLLTWFPFWQSEISTAVSAPFALEAKARTRPRTYRSESKSSRGRQVGELVASAGSSDVGDLEGDRSDGVLGVVESNFGGADDGLKGRDGSVGVGQSSSLLGDSVKLRAADGRGDGDGRVLQDVSNGLGVHLSVVTDKESDDTRYVGGLRGEGRGRR